MSENPWRGAYAGAWKRGREARIAGEPATACPYSDKRTDANRVSFSRAFIKAWHEGYESVGVTVAQVADTK